VPEFVDIGVSAAAMVLLVMAVAVAAVVLEGVPNPGAFVYLLNPRTVNFQWWWLFTPAFVLRGLWS
jgi:hypothetical protein